MSDRFSDRSLHVMALAQKEALRLGCDYVGTEHLLLALLKEPSRRAAFVLRCLGKDPQRMAKGIVLTVPPGEYHDMVVGAIARTPRTQSALQFAQSEANELGQHWIDPEHLLLGLLREEESVGAQVLLSFGVTLAEVRGQVPHLA